jgi:hypothetical protein
VEKLEKLKIHPREPIEDVIKRLLDKAEAASVSKQNTAQEEKS